MSTSRHLVDLWDGGWSVGALAAVTTPLVAVPLIAPEVHRLTDLAGVSGVVAYVVILFADVLIYLHWRISGGEASWLVLALTALTIQSLALAGFVAANPISSRAQPTRVLFVQIAVATGLFVLVARAPRYRLRLDPMLAGAAVGGAIVVVRHLLISYTGPVHLAPGALHALTGAVLLIDLAIAVALFRLTAAPLWVRARLGWAMALLSLGHAASYPVPEGATLSLLTVVANVLGATILLTLAIALVRVSWTDNRAALDLLNRQLERAEAGVRAERARLHELRATVAGLGAASRLVHHGTAIPDFRRNQIEDMIDAEMERLQRLLNNDDTPISRSPVDLDATIQPIVLRHRLSGYPIRWRPSGEWAIARADDVAEVVNVLLENACQHAPGAGATIEMRRDGRVVEIAVSDTGPGISGALRPKIFEWGERGQRSAGSGIGLHVAHHLTSELGGYLRLVDSSTPGSTFVLGLPAKDPS